MNKTYERKVKEAKPVIAICYDFDKTLTPDDMQAQGYIQSVEYDTEDFWNESNNRARENDMDQNLAYMYMMYKEARGKVLFTKRTLNEYGKAVKLFPGVETWFNRINKYGEENNVIVEHYIISSGLKEMIEGTQIAKQGVFEKIYASSFLYNDAGEAIWPAQAINYTNKTQFLFRIEKGVLDVNDPGINEYFNPEDIRVPFRNMVYIGDSDTDIPCMKLVNTYGGHSIGVYNSKTEDKTKVYNMIKDNRIKYFVPADYSQGSKLELLVKSIIERTAKNEILENEWIKCKKETIESYQSTTNEDRKKQNLIMRLKESGSFATTHSIIGDLVKVTNFSNEEKKELCQIALRNSQVRWVLQDEDVCGFYGALIQEDKELPIETEEIFKIIHKG